MDARFDTSKDPRFQKVPQNVRKVQVDKRFEHMFNDKRFVEAPKVDSRGRKQRKGDGRLKLREFYALDEQEGNNKATRRKGGQKKKGKSDLQDEDGATAEKEDEDGEADAAAKVQEGDQESEDEEDLELDEEDESEAEDEEDDDDDDDEEEDEPLHDVWAEEEVDAPTGDASRRLAVMGCDWDQIKVQDLMVLFTTYLKGRESEKGGRLGAAGSISKVTVYPSDYGLDQMAKEEVSGPQFPELGQKKAKILDGDRPNATEEAEVASHTEQLRAYQVMRTKYFWALVECDSISTASWLYDQLDGMEAIAICPRSLDIRFVPDDIKPPHKPHSETTEMPRKYQAPAVLKSALGQSKVECLWDETPAQRNKDLKKKRFTATEMADMDLKTYLASSSGEEGPDGEAAEALKALVGGGGGGSGDEDSDFFNMEGDDDVPAGKKDELGNMEATFSVRASELEESLTARTKQAVQNLKGKKKVHTLEAEEEKSVWEKYLDKKKAKRKQKRDAAKAEREARKSGTPIEPDEEEEQPEAKTDLSDLTLLAEGHDEEDARGFNVRGSQRNAHRGKGVDGTAPLSKRKKRARAEAAAAGQEPTEKSFSLNLEDPRISKVFSSSDFQIDPTNPEFRRTEGMGAVLKKKRQRKVSREVAAPARASAAAAGADAPAALDSSRGGGAESKASSGAAKGGIQLFAGGKRSAQAASDPQVSEPAEAAASATRKKRRGAKS